MNNRFNNPPNRDRSPPRYDRRLSSNTYAPGVSSYRGTADASQPPPDRGPPLGPKADNFGGSGRFPYSPSARGRGSGPFTNRAPAAWGGDRDQERDRERDSRPPQSYRSRDDDRIGFARRERDLAPGDRGPPVARDSRPYIARERSASPQRARRDSRDSIPPLSSRPSDTGSYYGASTRGGLGRGRGRGDYDRLRGRNSFAGERDRDLFGNRSRSREGWRDFDRGRPSAIDPDRGDRYERRDHERSREREPRREYDSWQRDHSPSRASTGARSGRGASPVNASATATHHGPSDRSSKMDYEMTRRPSAALTPGSVGRDRRDLDHTDYFGSRTETPRRDGPSSSYSSQTAPTPAAAAGLDYGPPPSVPTPAPSTVDKSVANKAPSAKADTAHSSGSTFLPPSGPKADRTSSLNPPAQQQKPPTQQENVTRPDFTSRPFRPPVAPAIAATSDSIGKPGDSKADHKPSLPQTPDKSMPANVPVGPRASLGVGYKPRQPSSEPAPAAPASSKAMPPDHRNAAIPKGPRFTQEQWSTAGLSNRTTWVSPEYSRSKPSIMNPLGRDRPSFAPPAGPRSQTILPPHSEKPRIFPSTKGGGATSASPTNLGQKAALGGAHTLSRPAGMQASEDVDMSLPDSSEDEDEFDEDDFAASEEKHRQERILLEARKPPPLLQDTSIRHLLIRIQFLNMIMNEVIPKSSATADTFDDKAKAVEPSPIGLPSPEEKSEEREDRLEIKHPQPRGRPLSQPAINPIPTPPIDDLPFLFRGSPKRMAFDESDNEVENEAITTLFRQEFENEAFEWNSELQDMHADYRHRYPLWKQDVAMLDQERRELQPSPAPASPAPSAAPSVTPSLSHERTRGARNTTEADLQAAILMSQQSLKEEEERREREAASSSQPNYDTEAHVPSMMKPSEVELNFFEDTNRLIPTTLALDVFAYVPPEDDFTEEEQLAFIHAYCQYPKKWGRIAESLPGRSYKDCITHYYLTKNETKYKIMWRNSQPRKRRGRAATKPRSTALMSEMVYENDGDAAVAVTDTGRPRRAAAPTFGDTPGDSDISTPVPQSKRLALSKDANGDQVPTKSGRGRKAGGVAKPRRTKAQIQADQQQAAQLLPAGPINGSPQKLGAASRERSRTLLRAENGFAKSDAMGSPDISRVVDVEMAQYSQLDAERLSSSMAQAASNQPTSYWSVPEQQKFPQLIAYFGRDFGSIADFMKTKTATMIKNYYNRQIQDGKLELEEFARQAERRRASGEPIGAPPSPAAQTKRRYEATPSTASGGRPTTLQPDQGFPEAEQASVSVKSGYTEDFPSNAVQRSTSGVDLVAKPRPTRDILREAQPVAPGQAKLEELHRSHLFGQKPLTGPRTGYFKEEPHGFGLQSPHQHPLRPGETRIGELSLSQSLLSQTRDPLGASAQSAMQTPSSQTPSSFDRYGAALQQVHHGRSGSLGMVSHHVSTQDVRDLSSLRRIESNSRPNPYSLAPSQPSTSMPAHSSIPSRSDTGSTGPTTADQPKPAPAKRSNLMNLLNDDPPEPQPQKRTSIDSQKRSTLFSPQPVPVTSQSLSFEATRAQARSEDIHGLHRSIRGGPIGQPPASQLGSLSIRDSQPGFPGSHADQNNERWMDRFDPRPQSGPTEQRGMHQSPRVGAYSVVPPSNGPHQGARMEAQRPSESAHPDHRRMLSQMHHPGPNPSPPPQKTPQPMQPYRTLSGSSHHSRFGSTGFPQSQQMSQQSPHMHPVQQPPGPPSHPPSAGSTPVSSLHHQHQSRPSLEYPAPGRPLTIQQFQQRERDHEEQLRRQREMEVRQQAMRMPERDRDREHHLGGGGARHRDILSFGSAAPAQSPHEQPQSQQQSHPHHHSQQSVHGHSQHQHQLPQQQQHQSIMAGIPGARHLGFGAPPQHQHEQQRRDPIPRTFTPPGQPFGLGLPQHSQHAQHAQHHQQSNHQHQHAHQQSHQHGHQHHQEQQGAPQQNQHQHQQQQQIHPSHQGQGPPQGQGQPQPPSQSHPQSQSQPQSQHQHQTFGHGHGHFRGMSQGQPQTQGPPQGQGQGQGDGRDERR